MLLYDTMLRCWQLEGHQRPTFADLVGNLGSMVEELSLQQYEAMASPEQRPLLEPGCEPPPQPYVNVDGPAVADDDGEEEGRSGVALV